jgi:hypothetical protein
MYLEVCGEGTAAPIADITHFKNGNQYWANGEGKQKN